MTILETTYLFGRRIKGPDPVKSGFETVLSSDIKRSIGTRKRMLISSDDKIEIITKAQIGDTITYDISPLEGQKINDANLRKSLIPGVQIHYTWEPTPKPSRNQ